MVAIFEALTEDYIRRKAVLETISEHLATLFNKHHNNDYPPHLHLLAKYLILKYELIRRELFKTGAHLKHNSSYLVLANGLQYKYANLTVYIDHLSCIPSIDDHFDEILQMITM